MEDQDKYIHQLMEVTQFIALLLEDFKAQAVQNNQDTEGQVQLMKQTLLSAKSDIDALLNKAGMVIETETKQAITQSTKERFATLENRVNQWCQQMDTSVSRIDQSSSKISRQTKMQSWTVIGASVLTAIAVVGFSFWYGNNKRQEIEALKKYSESIEYNINVKKALNKANFALCGAKLCLRTDETMPRYGKDKEYIIVE